MSALHDLVREDCLTVEPAVITRRLTAVVPAYRTGPAIVTSLRRLSAALDATGLDYEVVVVADGDLDAYRFASTCASARVRVVGYQQNRGKGFALRYGIAAATGELVTFVDADMQIAPEEIGRMVKLLELYEADIVVGSKRHPMSRVDYPAFRRLQSWSYQVLVRSLFRVNVRDTQTGLKVLRREVAADVLDVAVVKRFAFDLELLAIARRFGHRRIIEAPVTIDRAFETTTDLKAVKDVLQDTAAIAYRMYVRHWYDERHGRGLAELQASTPAVITGGA